MALNARLLLEIAVREGKTYLKHSFCNPPFKIADVTEDKSRKALRLMLRSSSPGMLDGDNYCLKINVCDAGSLAVETQSYQRLFSMKKGATQVLEVHVGSGALLSYLPHPLVPQEAAIFYGRNAIHLKEDSSLIWGEVISCGRKLNGEVFKFSSYHSVTEIFQNKKLVVKENILLVPSQMNVQGIGQLEGFSHQATLIFINKEVDVPLTTSLLNESLQGIRDISFGVTALPVNGILVRLVGHSAETLFSLVKQLASLVNGLAEQQAINKLHVV